MFTYSEDLTNDRDWIRFKTGDTQLDKSFLSDEIITSLLATSASKQHAVLAAVGYIITQLSNPDFKADWLEVKNSTARAAWEKTLARLEGEFGITLTTSRSRRARTRGINTFRGDSETITEPNYTGGRRGDSDPGSARFDYYNSAEYAYELRQQAEGRGDE